MNYHWTLAGVLVVSGALICAETLGENKSHGEYNVPALNVNVSAIQATNTTAVMVGFTPGPMNYQSASTNHILVVKG